MTTNRIVGRNLPAEARNVSTSDGLSERLTSPLTVRLDLGKRSSAQR